MTKLKKYVVFDLDETLGCFVELGMLYDSLHSIYGVQLTNGHFNMLLDLFPEFLRPNILSILNFVKKMKIQGKCNKVIIYTNNQGPESWAKSIMNYFNHKLNYELFDQIIGAYTINGRVVEPGRSSDDKLYKDLVKCANLTENSKVCFIDDQYHEGMKHSKVCYINIKPYKQYLPLGEIANRYYSYFNPKIERSLFISRLISSMSIFSLRIVAMEDTEKNVDKIIGKKMLEYIKDFFIKKRNVTLKKRPKIINKSKRKRKRK